MNTDTTDSNIPTLTEIIQSGDESMANHFDAHYFDSESDQDADVDIKKVKKFEPFISDDIENIDQNEADDELIVDDDNPLHAELAKFDDEELNKIIHSIIKDAIQDILPEMEQKLTQQISQQVQQKLFNSNAD